MMSPLHTAQTNLKSGDFYQLKQIPAQPGIPEEARCNKNWQ